MSYTPTATNIKYPTRHIRYIDPYPTQLNLYKSKYSAYREKLCFFRWFFSANSLMKLLRSLFLFLFFQLYSGQLSIIPLSSTSYSYSRGNKSSNIKVELYIDLTCSATLDVWDLLNEVYLSYQDKVNFEYHIFPLPYHQQAFILSKAAATVDYYCDSSSVFTFMDTTFLNQAATYNSATADMTYNDVVAMVQPWALNGTCLTSEQYMTGMDRNTDEGNTIEANARYMWKFGTIHDIFGTPLYVINGVKVMGLSNYKQWQETLDPLLN